MSKPRSSRPSISVSRSTYELLRAKSPPGGVSRFVDEIMRSALDDPETLARLVDRCQYDGGAYLS